MRIFIWGLIALFGSFQIGQAQQNEVILTCQLAQCDSKPNIYRFNGVSFEKVGEPMVINDSLIRFTIAKSDEPSFYYVGEGNMMRPLLMGTEQEVKLVGYCSNMEGAHVYNSKVNTQYEGVRNQLNEFRRQTSLLIRRYRGTANNDAERDKVVADMKTLDDVKVQYLDSLKKVQPFFAKIVALDTYTSYDANPQKDKYLNEIDYFASAFFQYVDFSDKTYENLPWVYEAFKNYTATITGVGLSDGAAKKYLDKVLLTIPKGSRTKMLALGGIITTLKQKNSSSFAPFAEMFIAEFKDNFPAAAADLQKQIDMVKSFTVGGTAPDFIQKTPEGKEMKLSDLRGKVVLVDFWASWCGPCRRENPNVVKLYNEYKDKGFEILGVSLDQDKNRWTQAIQQDGLSWYHVSDLKGWNNEVAQLYSIRSIPQTILLDAEGKIIARNLRGEMLAKKLEELFSN